MDLNEIDIKTLKPADLRCNDTERLQLEPKESITLTIKTIKAFKTDYGILFNLIGDYEGSTYSISSWNIVVTPKINSILELENRKVKVTNTGAKKYKLEHF